MIVITVFRDKNTIRGFSARGHSNFGVRGTDIVCAAISTLSQTAILALARVAGVEPLWKKKDGLLECRIPTDADPGSFPACQLVFQTILAGMENIACQYPEYVKVTDEEV